MSTVGARVGVVIVTYNSAAEIAGCLESVRASSSAPIDIVVIDNASADDTVAIIERSFPAVRLIRNSINRYYAAASNQGLSAVGGDYALLLNPDTVLPVGGIDALCRCLDKNPRACAAAPQLVDPAGRRQHSIRQIPGLDTLWYDLTGLAFLFPRSRIFGRWRMKCFNGASEQDVEQPMASCLLIRRCALAEIGLFDERFPMFFNDVDWCRRAQICGWTIRYLPSVTVRHVGGAAINRKKVKMIWMGHWAYLKYLHMISAGKPSHMAVTWLSAPFVLLAALVRTFWWGGIRRLF